MTVDRTSCPDCGSDWAHHRFGCIWATPAKDTKAEQPVRIEYQRVAAHDPVKRPVHYTQGKVECIDAIESAVGALVGAEAFCTANAIKYLWRWKAKGGKEDLRKARWYIDRMLRDEPTKS